MSIRLKILIPMILVALGALALSGLQMWQGSRQYLEVAGIAERAIQAGELARDAHDSFEGLSDFMAEVGAMTHFIDAPTIKRRYDHDTAKISDALAELKAQALSAEMQSVSADATVNFDAWRRGAAVVLGVTAAQNVPVADEIRRKRDAVTKDLDRALDLSGRDSRARVIELRASQHAAMEIELTLALALGLGAAVSAWVVAQGLARPIRALVVSADRLSKGDVSVTFSAAARRDEIGEIARAVAAFRDNVMSAQATEASASAERQESERSRRQNESLKAAANEEQARVVSALSEGLGRLAHGDLTFRVGGDFSAAYARLKTDFNKSLDVLQQAMDAIAEGARDVQTGSTEIAGLAADLSARTGTQTASIEEAAAALKEITTTVKVTADNAAEARNVVSRTRTEAEKSGALARTAVAAIGRIQSSSQEIEKIIGVIDEIAFQTNLLALNAGVEAARAGETGRGFAVVATEVRALAQRSADASREIKTLISSSSAEVKEGVNLVISAGAALDRIAEQVGEIDRVVAAIAGGASEQAASLQSVNRGVSEIDRVNQSNVDIVERTTSACEDLAGRADDLAGAVSRFETRPGASATHRLAA